MVVWLVKNDKKKQEFPKWLIEKYRHYKKVVEQINKKAPQK